jgi:hypothetical protein
MKTPAVTGFSFYCVYTHVEIRDGILSVLCTGRIQTPNYIVVVTAVMCIVALLLPTQGDQDTRFPMYLHLTSHLKMVFAYVLGEQ